uniref:Uncharacterized protein n=1 Tax=Fagus sylvatica TaxID=28930 RepID=A0A2N9H8C7_FAGSY
MVPRTEATGVFLVRLRAVFRSGFRLDLIKSWRSESSTSCMSVSSFQRTRACGSTCCESGRLCAQAWQRRWEDSGNFSTALFRQPVFTRMVDIAPDVGFRQSWYRRKAGATYFPKVQALHRGELGFARYGPANGGRWNVPYAKGGGQFEPVFGLVNGPVKPWSNLVNLGQTWSNLVKALQTLGNVSRTSFQGFLGTVGPSRVGNGSECLIRPGFVGSCGLDPGCPALRAGTRENPVAYLGGNVCAKILSDPLQLGPRAKTLRQEVHFSYHTQLSDRQELLRSSRNLSQKMTPWHKEHSDGLCSQDHILRTQARLCARPVPLKSRHIHARRGTLGSPRFYRGLAGIPIGKLSLKRTKNTPVASVRGDHISQVQARIPANPEPCKSRQRKLSDGTKNVKIRHRELGQICARTGTRFEKKRAGSKTHFFSRTAAFARRVFPARNKLIREPGCVGKIMTPATTWNSRFADSIPRLTGISSEKCTKTAPTPRLPGAITPLVRTPIRANFISLERGRRGAFRTICRMTHFEFRKTSKTAPENRIKKGYAHGNRGGFEELLAWKDKTATWQYHNSRRTVMRRA